MCKPYENRKSLLSLSSLITYGVSGVAKLDMLVESTIIILASLLTVLIEYLTFGLTLRTLGWTPETIGYPCALPVPTLALHQTHKLVSIVM